MNFLSKLLDLAQLKYLISGGRWSKLKPGDSWWRRVQGERMNWTDLIHLMIMFIFGPTLWMICVVFVPTQIDDIFFPLFLGYSIYLKLFPIPIGKIPEKDRWKYPRRGRRPGEYSHFFQGREPFWKNRELHPVLKSLFNRFLGSRWDC